MRNDMTAAWCIMKHDVTWLTNGRGIAELHPLGRKECKPLTELKREREREVREKSFNISLLRLIVRSRV